MALGTFITLEGGEGSGKSTQARRLVEKLRAAGRKVTETREPGGSAFAERLRQIILDPDLEPHSAKAEALLFYSARSDHLEQVIRPALARGETVICDRFSDSTRAYQGYAGSLDLKWLEALELLVVVPTIPDLTLIIDVPPEIGLARAALRSTLESVKKDMQQSAQTQSARAAKLPRSLLADRYEGRDLAFHKRLRDGFRDIALRNPKRCVLIDGHAEIDTVTERIWAVVEERIAAVGAS